MSDFNVSQHSSAIGKLTTLLTNQYTAYRREYFLTRNKYHLKWNPFVCLSICKSISFNLALNFNLYNVQSHTWYTLSLDQTL